VSAPPLRVAVVTQEDPFYIPRNVDLLCREPGLDVREIVVLDARGSVANMRGRLLRWFGPLAVARMAARAGGRAALDAANRLAGYRLPLAPTSLRAVARRHGIPFSVETDANAPAFVERLRGHGIDVLVSFSAPQVFRAELLGVPRLGCVNLHCSLLPRYRGLLPSFWVLFHGEEVAGATVHLMDTEIDNGAILKQAEVEIRGMRTMHEVLTATKRRGGELMVEALRELAAGTLRPLPNPADAGSYHTWPTLDDARRFRRRGYRLA
jgi:folate-dependent phosphoribosylglycinamide formyltransferase PurN